MLNKSDLGTDAGWSALAGEDEALPVSARTGEGFGDLRQAIREEVLGSGKEETGEVVTRERHVAGLRRAEEALLRALRALEAGEPGELVAFELEEALQALGEIIGQTAPQDVLDRIFASFCIGK